MTDEDWQQWVAARHPDAVPLLDRFAAMVLAENERQNLIAPSTAPHIWERHIADSAQLLRHGGPPTGTWVDIGSGGGFPGLVIAIIRTAPITLVEPRRKRAAFLTAAAAQLGLDHVSVVARRVEQVFGRAETISARAVAPIGDLLTLARSWATPRTRWILPRGTVSDTDMSALRRQFGSMFHVEHSVTAPASAIVVATGIPA